MKNEGLSNPSLSMLDFQRRMMEENKEEEAKRVELCEPTGARVS